MRAPSQADLHAAYRGKRVLVTGHTGFKGSWLTLWLASLEAQVIGYALAPEGAPNLFDAARVAARCDHRVGDVRDLGRLTDCIASARPDVIFHLAAQPLVRQSYQDPLTTVETNVLGTTHVLEAVRRLGRPCVVVVVTSDKAYENREWLYGYREDEAMGGHDVYAMSKGAAELVVQSYRRSFFAPAQLGVHGVAVATARSGNVIGGGDWSRDRIVPDLVRAIVAGAPLAVRHPEAVRPWQHVLEPLGGYLLLGARMAGVGTATPHAFCEAWNFGPNPEGSRTVRDVVEAGIAAWGAGSWADQSDPNAVHEATLLRLCIEKAGLRLGWRPRWAFAETCAHTMRWYRTFHAEAGAAAARDLCHAQIAAYMDREPQA